MDCITKLQVASSLNSSHCYILQDGGFLFTWLGSLSSPSDHNILDMMMNKLCVRRTLRANPSVLFIVTNIENCVVYPLLSYFSIMFAAIESVLASQRRL